MSRTYSRLCVKKAGSVEQYSGPTEPWYVGWSTRIIEKVASGAEEEHSVHGHSTLLIAAVARTWLVVWIECVWLSYHRIVVTCLCAVHMWEVASAHRRSVLVGLASIMWLPRSPMDQLSSFRVMSHVIRSGRLSSDRDCTLASNFMRLPIPFNLISSNHGTTRQCHRSEDQKAVHEAATSRSFIRFLHYSTHQQRRMPSRH